MLPTSGEPGKAKETTAGRATKATANPRTAILRQGGKVKAGKGKGKAEETAKVRVDKAKAKVDRVRVKGAMDSHHRAGAAAETTASRNKMGRATATAATVRRPRSLARPCRLNK